MARQKEWNMKTELKLAAFLVLAGCGSHSSGNPQAVEQKQAGNIVTETGGVTVEKLDSPTPPVDLAEQPWFVTQGFVIARERYKNSNDYPVQLLPQQSSASLQINWQVLFAFPASELTAVYSIPLTVSITAPRNQYEVERVSDSVLGSAITLNSHEEVTLNWRVSPAPGLPFAPNHLGVTTTAFTSTLSAQGSAIEGQLARSVEFSTDSDGNQTTLFSENLDVEKTGGTVGQVTVQPNNPGLHSIWIDYYNSSEGDYFLPTTGGWI
jgi:hypothetical protein